MSRSLLSFVVILVLTSSLHAQEVPEVQRPLLGKVAATWCPPCGGWGWDFFEELVVENEEKATLITAHHSGDLTNDVAKDFSSNFNAPYQPYFYYNTTDQDVSSSNTSSKLTEIKTQVEEESATSPIANAGFNLLVSGDNLAVESRTKFFQSAEGEYYLALYFVENEVIANQAGQGSNAVHEKILRGAISTGSFGELLENGTVAEGTEFNHTFEASLAGLNVEHLEVISIIWKKVGATYEVINTNISTNFQVANSTNNLVELGAELNVFPNSISASGTVELSLHDKIKQATLRVMDLNGKTIQLLHDGSLPAGTSQFSIVKESGTPSGLYLLTLESKEGVLTEKLYFK